MRVCQNCGQVLSDDTMFCSNCGNQLSPEQFTSEPLQDSYAASSVPEQPQNTYAQSPEQQPQNAYAQSSEQPQNPYQQQPVQPSYEQQFGQSQMPQQPFAQQPGYPGYGQSAQPVQTPYGQPAYGQQPMPYGQGYPSQQPPAGGKAITSLVMGILSILCLCLIFAGNALYMGLSIVPGIVGIVLGTLARGEAKRLGTKNPTATAGLACSVIGLVLGALMILLIVVVAIILLATDSMYLLDEYA